MKSIKALLIAMTVPTLATSLPAQTSVNTVPGQPANTAPGQPGAQVPGTPLMPITFVPSIMIEMRPTEKRPLIVRASERNPYANRSQDQRDVNDNGENVEEVKIRQQLQALSVTGQSQGLNGLRLLLGDIIIERGEIMPQLLEDQSATLQVVEVTTDLIVLGWVDVESGELTGKSMPISYDLSPSVSYALHGQSNAESTDPGQPSERRMGVFRLDNKQLNRVSGMASRPPVEEDEREDN
tara:strand:+ start:431 stop:1147 length:717 start_codon:yes stop_codon:yes gene_type:complete